MGESRVRINGVKRFMSIGILGGTFNPVHFGHLRSAEEVCEEFNLGKVFFIPSAQPPHKKSENIIASRYRKEMVEIAIRGNPRFEISTIEIEREGNSYTIDTIYALKKIYTDDIYLISGFDTFKEFSTWRSVKELVKSCHFIVTSRPGGDLLNLPLVLANTVTIRFPEVVFTLEGLKGRITVFNISGSRYKLFALEITGLDISATAIRERVRQGKSIKYLVPQEIEEYIKENRLYIS